MSPDPVLERVEHRRFCQGSSVSLPYVIPGNRLPPASVSLPINMIIMMLMLHYNELWVNILT